jgi:hypothetical protein
MKRCEDYPACGHDWDGCADFNRQDSFEDDGDWMDGDALASAGFGTDEDYGYYGGEDW